MIEMHRLHGFNQGYYKRFFVEEKLLGRGGNGAVYLCWHELEGHRLGRFAVKIVPVGDSEEWLSRRLQEVRTMCRLKHPNIIEYKHAWMEEWSGSPFAPRIPCLFILMEYADAGSLENVSMKALRMWRDCLDKQPKAWLTCIIKEYCTETLSHQMSCCPWRNLVS